MIPSSNVVAFAASVVLLCCCGSSGHPQRNAPNNICITPECARVSKDLLQYVDTSINPCDNFYDFACGTYIKTNKDDYSDHSPMLSSTLKIDNGLRKIYSGNLEANAPKAAVLVKRFYDACMHSFVSNGRIDYVKEIVKQLGGWPVVEGSNWNEDDFDLVSFHRKARRLGLKTNFLFEVEVEEFIQVKSFKVKLTPPKHIFSVFSDLQSTQAESVNLVRNADILGANLKFAGKELIETMVLGHNLSQFIIYDKLWFLPINKMQEVSNFPWLDYVNSVLDIPGQELNSSETIVVKDSNYYSFPFIDLVPKRTLANFMIWNVVKYLMDIKEVKPNLCAAATNEFLPVASSALYIRKYFDPEIKVRVTEMVADLRKAFRTTLETTEWMNEDVRKKALDKLDAMKFDVAYPDELLDDKKIEEFYSDLNLDAHDNNGIMNAINKFNTDLRYKSLREPHGAWPWYERANVLHSNALNVRSINTVFIYAGLLGGNFFDLSRPRYMNYAAMSFIIAHEITHGFDDEGAKYDKDGNIVTHWGNDTEVAFNEKNNCLIDQYGSYRVAEVDTNIDGRLTVTENAADNGGARTGYRAYQDWAAQNQPEGLLPDFANYTTNQMFWISVANPWCSVATKSALKRQMNEIHPLERYRIIGSLVNNEDFSKDFSCPLGSNMNPEHKCRLW